MVGIQHAAEMLLTGQVRRRVTGHGQSQRRRQSALAGWLAAVRLNPSRAGGGPAAWPLQVISGEEAALRGLVLRTADEPLAEALNLAGRIAEQAPLAVRATTRALRCALRYCATALRGPTCLPAVVWAMRVEYASSPAACARAPRELDKVHALTAP